MVKSFSTPTRVVFQRETYIVVGVDEKFFEGGAVRLQHEKTHERLVVSEQDAEWQDLLVLENPKRLNVEG